MLLDAQNEKETYNPICFMIVFKENVIYFTFRVVVINLDTTKQIWYEKLKGNGYFINKIVYYNYNNLKKYIKMHFRNHTFSDPNICMIRMQGKKDWEYFVGDIEDSFFYRVIEFGDTETVFKNLDTSFEPYCIIYKNAIRNL